MSGTTRTLYAIAPDGTEISVRCSGDYSFAGLIKNRDGEWQLATKGYSKYSVTSRTRTVASRTAGTREDLVVPLLDRVQMKVRNYFQETIPEGDIGRMRVIASFTPGTGWHQMTTDVRLSEEQVRRWKRMHGVTDITVECNGRTPDFPVEHLLAIDRRPALSGSLIGSSRARNGN